METISPVYQEITSGQRSRVRRILPGVNDEAISGTNLESHQDWQRSPLKGGEDSIAQKIIGLELLPNDPATTSLNTVVEPTEAMVTRISKATVDRMRADYKIDIALPNSNGIPVEIIGNPYVVARNAIRILLLPKGIVEQLVAGKKVLVGNVIEGDTKFYSAFELQLVQLEDDKRMVIKAEDVREITAVTGEGLPDLVYAFYFGGKRK
ncbi:hypothetical protein JW766_01695 [Candidatus Dojkabacteria bacterium]|nr:hypothetical protein [Candidatus Dojkabacteria bacterium]